MFGLGLENETKVPRAEFLNKLYQIFLNGQILTDSPRSERTF